MDIEKTAKTPIKTYNKKDFCAMYGVNIQTLNKWLCQVPIFVNNTLDLKSKRLFTPAETKAIFEHLGDPTET